jgi:hypothetical protein
MAGGFIPERWAASPGIRTRVTKPGGGAYLVCAKANSKAGTHEYQAVHYLHVEEAFRNGDFIEEAPRGEDTAEAEARISQLFMDIFVLETVAEDLAEEWMETKSPTLRGRLRQVEEETDSAREELRRLRADRDSRMAAHVQRRLGAMRDALAREPFDVAEANAVMRQAIRVIVMDVEAGSAAIHWHHTAEPQEVTFLSRHYAARVFGSQGGTRT